MSTDVISEVAGHPGTASTIMGVMGLIIGALAMAAYHYFKDRLAKVEERQNKLRDEVLPTLMTREDMKDAIGVLEKVGFAFVERVEHFMTACHSGECSMAVLVKNFMAPNSGEEVPPRRTARGGHGKEGA